MLDTSTPLGECSKELGLPCEQLLTPLTRFAAQDPSARFAIDNGAFSNFDAAAFVSLLEREWPRRSLCRFVALPDVVGSARRTLEVFGAWWPRYHHWPIALVAQDGQEELSIPWSKVEAVFIGGTTAWKMSPHVEHIIKAAKAMGKWVHVGRVNTPGRLEHFQNMGADSIDGTGLSRYSWMRKSIYESMTTPQLFEARDGNH